MRWRRRLVSFLIPCMVGLIGLVTTFQPILASRLHRLTGDPGDTRFNEYMLEHSWGWLTGNPVHRDFWSPGFFYPTEMVATFSDLMVSFALPYWVARFAGLQPDNAMGAWVLATGIANYITAYWLLRKGWRVSFWAGSLGGYLIAFGVSRIQQLCHPQLFPAYYLLGASLALCLYFSKLPVAEAEADHIDADRGARRGWMALFFLCVIAQPYGGFYMAYFFGFTLVIALGVAMANADMRTHLRSACRRDGRFLILCGMVGMALLYPLGVRYYATARALEPRDWGGILVYSLPRAHTWLFVSEGSVWYAWMSRCFLWRDLPFGPEVEVGIGLVTTVAAGFGIWWGRHRPAARLMAWTVLAVLVVVTQWWDGFALWRIVFTLAPGAAAIRVLSRIGVLLLIPAGLGLALLLDGLAQTRLARLPGVVLALLLAGVCCAEQAIHLHTFDADAAHERVSRIKAKVDGERAAFLVTTEESRDDYFCLHLDAMWASSELGIPTLNGYSGNSPNAWDFWENTTDTALNRQRVQQAYRRWAEAHGLSLDQLQWIELPTMSLTER